MENTFYLYGKAVFFIYLFRRMLQNKFHCVPSKWKLTVFLKVLLTFEYVVNSMLQHRYSGVVEWISPQLLWFSNGVAFSDSGNWGRYSDQNRRKQRVIAVSGVGRYPRLINIQIMKVQVSYEWSLGFSFGPSPSSYF